MAVTPGFTLSACPLAALIATSLRVTVASPAMTMRSEVISASSAMDTVTLPPLMVRMPSAYEKSPSPVTSKLPAGLAYAIVAPKPKDKATVSDRSSAKRVWMDLLCVISRYLAIRYLFKVHLQEKQY